MTATVITPFTRASAAIELGNRLWRKRILPVGDVQYKGRVLKFTRPYLEDLARAFKTRAYDQVPFQIAPDDNRHTNDPERFRGEILDVEVAPDGLYATVKTTPAGEQILSQNPALGVSARIVENYERSDGQYFGAALQHVLGTLDPRIPSLGPWQAIEASNSGEIVIDLSGETFDGEAGSMLDAGEDLLGEILDELLAEEGALENWAQNGDPAIDSVISAWLADPADMNEPHLDDLSNSYAEPIDLSGYEHVSEAIELAQQHQERDMARTRMARMIGLDGYQRRGDMIGLMESLVEAGTAGHPVELANRGAYDAQAIELATGRYAHTCSVPDAYGRCSGQASGQHDASCSHNAGASASRGATPADSAAWQAALQRHAGIPAADADGRFFRTTDGRHATFADHYEAQTGTARRASRFEPGPDGTRAPAVIEREPDIPASTRDTAARFIAQHMPSARPKDAQWARLEARMSPARQAAVARLRSGPDHRAAGIDRQRELARSVREPLQFSNGYTDEYGEDLTGPLLGSLPQGIGGL